MRQHNDENRNLKKSLGTTFVSEATNTLQGFAPINHALLAMKTKGFLPLQTTVKGLTRQEFTVNHMKDKSQPPNLTINSFKRWDGSSQDRAHKGDTQFFRSGQTSKLLNDSVLSSRRNKSKEKPPINHHSPTHPSSFASPKSTKSNKQLQESPFVVLGQTHRNSRGSFTKQTALYKISSKQDLESPPKDPFKHSPKVKDRLNIDMVDVMMTFQNSN